ncbi:hypothetical protein [Marinobacter sp. OP 3.4]|uniref:hypothetical protein n=1 Tax=Marinobacter sp. OP 3.4 TaxID=3076501 RepID=UPI002E23595E
MSIIKLFGFALRFPGCLTGMVVGGVYVAATGCRGARSVQGWTVNCGGENTPDHHTLPPNLNQPDPDQISTTNPLEKPQSAPKFDNSRSSRITPSGWRHRDGAVPRLKLNQDTVFRFTGGVSL